MLSHREVEASLLVGWKLNVAFQHKYIRDEGKPVSYYGLP